MAEEFQYYKNNVNYSIVVRAFIGDKDGTLLSPRGQHTIGVKTEDLREFKNANKKAITSGLIVPVEEPNMDWEVNNALTDQDISELLKNFPKVKSTLPTIDSLPILYKMLEEANTRELSKKTTSLIQARIDELEPEDQPIFRKEDMQGGKDG